MGYQDSSACKIMASNCCCCGRPLVDAKSVEIGIGPECRKRVGYDLDVPEENRVAANKIIYQLALNVDSPDISYLEMSQELVDLGFPKIAEIFQNRGSNIVITIVDGEIFVRAPFSPEFNQASWCKGRHGVKIPTALSKRQVFHWAFPLDQKAHVFKSLQKCFDGMIATGPKGPFVISSQPAQKKQVA